MAEQLTDPEFDCPDCCQYEDYPCDCSWVKCADCDKKVRWVGDAWGDPCASLSIGPPVGNTEAVQCPLGGGDTLCQSCHDRRDSHIDMDLYEKATKELNALLGGDFVSGARTNGGGYRDGGDYIEVRLNEQALRELCSLLAGLDVTPARTLLGLTTTPTTTTWR